MELKVNANYITRFGQVLARAPALEAPLAAGRTPSPSM